MKGRYKSKNKYKFLIKINKNKFKDFYKEFFFNNKKRKKIYFAVSIIILSFFILTILPRVLATTTASIEKTTDADFNQGTLSDTVIVGEDEDAYVKLDGDVGDDPWWDNDFRSRKPITITNSGSELTNYQIQVTLDTQSLINDGKMQSDCDDIRFTNQAGDTEYSYWIESGCNSLTTKIWVKISSIPNGDSKIFVYYNNEAASAGSSGENTFVAFNLKTDGPISGRTSLGGYHRCAIISDKTVKCWGYNNYGQLGNNTTVSSSTPVSVSGLSNAVAVATGIYHSCAILADGTAKCWGYNGYGQLGDGTTTNRTTPVSVSGLSNVIGIALGDSYSCALISGGTAKCWGYNGNGRLGDGTTTNRYTPVSVSGLSEAILITTGGAHTCALLSSGAAKCWGNNSYGQLGDGSTTQRLTPVDVEGLSSASQLALGYYHSCALLSGGTMKCWGYNSYGQLGDGTTINKPIPSSVDDITSAVTITAGTYHTCALLSGGTAKCWGYNFYGQVGDGTQTNRITATTVSGLSDIVSIGGGYYSNCALLKNGTARCWGENYYGGLGDSSAIFSTTPVSISGLSTISGISATGEAHTCAYLSDNTARCWGQDNYGQLGNDSNTFYSSSPVTVSGLSTVNGVAAGQTHSCAKLSDGTAKCWGYNNYGQLGDGTTTTRYTPVTVSGLSNVSKIVTGYNHSCALISDGTIKCWGRNSNGQLGDGTTTNRTTPVSVSGISTATDITGGGLHTCAVLADGTARCWGYNGYGQIGDGTTTQRTTPVSVSGLTNTTTIAAGYSHTCARRSDNTLRCWGYNGYGQLGDGTTTNRTTPVSVSGISTATSITTGYYHTCAPLSDNTARCWGYNWYGNLGDGTQTNRTTPVSVSGLSNVSEISAGGNHTCARISDNTGKCWGLNFSGQLGNARTLYGTTSSLLTTYDFTGRYDKTSGVYSVPNFSSDYYFARKYSTTEPSVGSAGTEESLLPDSGTWISPSSTNVIDMVFNGGWGDGTDSSTAFQAHVSNVGANSSVKFEMRVASTTDALATAEWKELGTINSGDTFTKTKEDLDILGIEEGQNRYVQVRATLYSIDGVTNPRVNDFTIYYLKDNDPPTEDALLMQAKNQEGGTVDLINENWYNYAHPYFEFESVDNCNPDPGCSPDVENCCAGIEGYWVYFGTDCEEPLDDPETTGEYFEGATGEYNANLSSNGTYCLVVKSKDLEGNKGPITKLFTYKYDKVPPENPGYLTLPSDFIQTHQFTMSWPVTGGEAASDEDSGVKGYQYKINTCSWYGPNHNGSDDDVFTPETGSYETTVPHDYTAPDNDGCLDQGINYIYLRTWDNAGNVASTTVQGIVKINTEAPSAPQNLTVTPSTSVENEFSFDWDPPASQPAPIEAYHYSINSLPTANNHYTTVQTSLSEGPYATMSGENTFYVVAVAEGGAINYDNYASVKFTCNAPAPGIPENIDIFDASIRETKSYKVGLSWDEPDDKGAGFEGYKIYRSTVTNASCDKNFDDFQEIASTSGTAFIDSNLQSRRYYYCIKAFDNTNQESAASDTVSLVPTGRWKVPPELTKEPEASVRTRSATITWITEREANSFVRYGVKSGIYGTEVGFSDEVIYHTVPLNGLEPETTYYYKAIWTDEDGNQGMSKEYSFTTGPAPKVSNVKVSDISLNSAYLEFDVENATQANVYYGKTTMYGGVLNIATSQNKSSYTVRFSDLEDDTLYHYMIELYDEEGNKYQFEDHTFKTLPKPKVYNIKIQQLLDRPSPTLEITYDSNTGISTVVNYYPKNAPHQKKEVSDLELKTKHKIEISGLKDDTLYILDVSGFDKLGNEAESELQKFTTATDTRPPKITDLFVESRVKGQGSEAEAQIIVSWKTDEPATSQVGFGQGAAGNYTNYTIEDPNLAIDHLVVISGLKPASIYHVAAVSYDSAKNRSISEDWSVLTSKATESALDLIIQSLKEIFGIK